MVESAECIAGNGYSQARSPALTFAHGDEGLAQPAAAWSLCSNDGISSQQRINGCTLVIQSGTEGQGRLATAYNNRGFALLDRGDYDLALADFDAAIKLNPSEAGYFYNRANSLLAKNENDRAIVDFDQAIKLNAKLSQAYAGRGRAYANKREFDRAIADLSQAIRLDPKLPRAYSNRGVVYSKKREFTLAVVDFDQAIKLDPRYTTAYIFRAVANYNRAAYDSAIADFDAALTLDPDAVEALFGRGMAKQKNGDSSGSVDMAAAKAISSRYCRGHGKLRRAMNSGKQFVSLIRVAIVACITMLALPAVAIVGGARQFGTPGGSIVMILGVRGNDSILCTGTAIARDLVLTAAHCVAPGTSLQIMLSATSKMAPIGSSRSIHATMRGAMRAVG